MQIVLWPCALFCAGRFRHVSCMRFFSCGAMDGPLADVSRSRDLSVSLNVFAPGVPRIPSSIMPVALDN
eukprot:4553628-Karenia_brevis.AAC.1